MRGLFTLSYYDIFVIEENNQTEVHLTLANCNSHLYDGVTLAFLNLPAIAPLEEERETVQYFTDRLGNAYELYFGKSSNRLKISIVLSVPKVYSGVLDATTNPEPKMVAGLFTMDSYGISVAIDATSSMIEFKLKEPNHFYGIQVNTISPDDVVVKTVKWFRDSDNGTPYELVLLANGKIAVRLAD